MTVELLGTNKADSDCFSSALSAQVTGGGPHAYTLPRLVMGTTRVSKMGTVLVACI